MQVFILYDSYHSFPPHLYPTPNSPPSNLIFTVCVSLLLLPLFCFL